MRGRYIVGRGLLVAATVILLSTGTDGSALARGGRDLSEKADALRDRFTQRDTADLVNRYTYADNDPIDHLDPDGH